jgi:EpsI family protein
MTEHNRSNNRSVIIAAVTAALIMFGFGAAHRSLTARLMNSAGISPMSPDALDKLPLQIGDWTGQEEPLDEDIIEATDTDAHISRRYSRYNTSEQVWLYIAAGIRARDLMPHRPEVCYTGAGWTRVSSDARELLLEDGKELPCSVFQFSKGALNTKNVIILDYYVVDGQLCRDISLMRSKIWRGSGTIRYVAQVQIVTDITTDRTAEAALKIVSVFACESAKTIFQVLENAADIENKDEEHLSANDSPKDLTGD